MARLNDTKGLVGMGCPGTNGMSLPDSGRATTAVEPFDVPLVIFPTPPKGNSAPDASGRSLSCATGYLRGGLRGAPGC